MSSSGALACAASVESSYEMTVGSFALSCLLPVLLRQPIAMAAAIVRVIIVGSFIIIVFLVANVIKKINTFASETLKKIKRLHRLAALSFF